MGSYEQDSNPENDGEDSWEMAWSEFDWEQYLRSEDDEIARYQTLYGKLARSPNRLDEVALYMGWQRDSDTPGDSNVADASDDERDPAPYTLHRHPLFVASKALHGWLVEKWTPHVALCSEKISPESALAYQSALAQSDYYGLLTVTALDLDDFALAIAYLKRGISAINKAHALLNEFESMDIDPIPLYVRQARLRLFDLREIWLRVSSDCRATIARGSGED